MTPVTIGFDVDVPDYALEMNDRAVLKAMADEAVRILQARLPRESGDLARSVRAQFEGAGAISVGPTGERNLIKARVFRKRGEDLFDLDAGEKARIIAAGQRELDAQISSGETRLEG